MKIQANDLRCMWRGINISTVNPSTTPFFKGFQQHGHEKNTALLLLHGFSSSPAVFRELIPQIHHYDAIVAPVLKGHAENLQAFSRVKQEEWFKQVELECANLCKIYQRVDVLGLSLGGLLACHLSHKFSLGHLYLLAPAFDLHLSLSCTLPAAYLLKTMGFQYLRAKAGNLSTPGTCEIAYRQLPIPTIIEVLTTIKHFPFSAPPCPTDLFLGREDAVVNSERVATKFANNPLFTTHWLEEAAHVLPLEKGVSSFIANIVNYNVCTPAQSTDSNLAYPTQSHYRP